MTENSPADSSFRYQLRQRAEEHLQFSPDNVSAMSPDQVRVLVHELQVQQIELQLQNEELLRAQKELGEIRDRYFDLFELAPVGYLTFGPDYRVRHCNLSAAAMFGMERSQVENAALESLVARDDRDSCFLALRATLETGQRQTRECALACPAGAKRYAQLAVAPLDEHMPASGGRVTLTEITQRKEAEAALRELNDNLERAVENRTAELRSITDAAHDAILLMDPHGAISYWNPAAERILGYSAEEALGKNLHDLIAPERYHSDHRAAYPEFVRSGQGNAIGKTLELFARRRDGREIPVSLSLSAVFLSGAWHAVGILADITDRKLAEMETARANDRMRQLIDALPIGVIVADDPLCQVIHSNPTAARMLEIATGDNASTSAAVPLAHRYLHQGRELKPEEHPMQLAVFGNRDVPPMEIEARLSSGRRWTALISASPLHDAEGRVIGGVGAILDITERKLTEELLRESEWKYRIVADNTYDWEFWLDSQGRFVYCSPSCQRISGHAPEEFMADSSVLEAIIHPEDRAGYLEHSRHVLSGGEPGVLRFRIIRPDGTERWIEHVCQLVYDDTGHMMGRRGSHRDITQQQQAEAARDASEARCRAYFDQAADSIVVHDLSGRVLDVNQQACTSLGYSRKELMRLRLPELDNNFDWESAQSVCRQLTPGKPLTVTGQHRRKDGTTFPAEIRIGCFDLEGERYCLASARDITDRKLAELDLQRSNERLELATQAAGQGIWDWNILTGEINWSPGMYTLFGSNPEAHTPPFAEWEAALHPEDRVAAHKSIDEAIRDRTLFNTEYRVVHPDGQVRWIGAIGRSAHDNDGRALRMTGVCMDITERRAMQEKIQKWNTELEHTVAIRTAELAAEQARTAQALKQVAASETRLRSIGDNLPRGAVYQLLMPADGPNRFTYMSAGIKDIFGISAEQVLTHPQQYWDRIVEEDRPRLEATQEKAARELTHFECEFRQRTVDGQVKWLLARSTPQQLEDGAIRWDGLLLDITEHKAAEDALTRLNENLEQQVQQRTEAIRMLRDVAVMANESQDPLRAAEYCLKQLATQFGWLCGHAWWITAENEQFLSPRCVWYPEDTDRWDDFRTATLQTRLRRNAGLPGRAIAGGRPLWSTRPQRVLAAPRAAVAQKLGLATAVAAPVFSRGRAVAVLEFFSDRQLPCDPKTMDVLTGVALQLGRIVERREFDEHLLASTEDVRRGIARDLHDDVGQELTGVSLMAAALAELNPPSTRPTIKLSADIAAALSRTHEKLRRLCHSAMPMELQEGNLVSALAQLAAFTRDNSRIECDFACEHPEWAFDDPSSTQLYRIAQEAISNAIRHARARSIWIAMQQKAGHILLTIEDNGKGLPDDLTVNQGLGLQTMRYRAGLLGGTLEMDRGENGGTRVVCRVPASLRSSQTSIATKRPARCRRKS